MLKVPCVGFNLQNDPVLPLSFFPLAISVLNNKYNPFLIIRPLKLVSERQANTDSFISSSLHCLSFLVLLSEFILKMPLTEVWATVATQHGRSVQRFV